MKPYDNQPIKRPSRNEMLWFLNSIIENCEDFNLDPNGGHIDTAKRELHFLQGDWTIERKLNTLLK